jgi:hypothetical protein
MPLLMRSTSHLSRLNDICQVHVLSQFCRASMSSWSLVSQYTVISAWNSMISPAVKWFVNEKNLSWNNHVNNITKKANSTLAFLRRNIRNCPQRAQTQACNIFVRPSLEYASTVWDPHQCLMELGKKEDWYASTLVEGCRYRMLCPLVSDLDGMR